jgi:hypothetical protein
MVSVTFVVEIVTMTGNIKNFYAIDDLFSRYSIYVDVGDNKTFVVCEECKELVFEEDGDMLSHYSENDFYEYIISRHEEQVLGERVGIAGDDQKI